MKKDSKSVTRSDLVNLVQQIHTSLRPEFKKVNLRLTKIEHSLDRIEKRNGHARNQIRKAGKNLTDV